MFEQVKLTNESMSLSQDKLIMNNPNYVGDGSKVRLSSASKVKIVTMVRLFTFTPVISPVRLRWLHSTFSGNNAVTQLFRVILFDFTRFYCQIKLQYNKCCRAPLLSVTLVVASHIDSG